MLKLYTDGSGQASGPCGWAFVVVDKSETIEYAVESGGQLNGTSNIGEMLAIINGLEWVQANRPPETVHIFTDSAYCMNAFVQSWTTMWLKRNWKNARGRKVANKELWLQLMGLVDNLDVMWHHVPSHTGIKYNELCDTLAGKERKKWLDISAMTTDAQAAQQ
jgi:ribonuclease HI